MTSLMWLKETGSFPGLIKEEGSGGFSCYMARNWIVLQHGCFFGRGLGGTACAAHPLQVLCFFALLIASKQDKGLFKKGVLTAVKVAEASLIKCQTFLLIRTIVNRLDVSYRAVSLALPTWLL